MKLKIYPCTILNSLYDVCFTDTLLNNNLLTKSDYYYLHIARNTTIAHIKINISLHIIYIHIYIYIYLYCVYFSIISSLDYNYVYSILNGCFLASLWCNNISLISRTSALLIIYIISNN